MFYKFLTGLFFITCSISVIACPVPRMGEEFNKYITINNNEEHLKTDNILEQEFTLPYEIKSPFYGEETIKFQEANVHIRGNDYADIIIPIKVTIENGVVKGEVSYFKDVAVEVDLGVSWYNNDSPCSVSGWKTLKYNKSLKHGTAQSAAP
jgi:hypothetical protein